MQSSKFSQYIECKEDRIKDLIPIIIVKEATKMLTGWRLRFLSQNKKIQPFTYVILLYKSLFFKGYMESKNNEFKAFSAYMKSPWVFLMFF